MKEFIGRVVLIRSYSSGVHFGTLERVDDLLSGAAVKLQNARRIHYWEGAASLSQIAKEGVNQERSRVAMELPEFYCTQVIECIPMSEFALDNLKSAPVWKI